MRFSRTRRDMAGVDLTPLIDIVFQLVLFFMVTTTFNDAPGIEIELPEASTNKVIRDDQDFEILIDANGDIFVNSQKVTLELLQQKIVSSVRRNANVLAVVRADQNVDHGKVVRILDLAQEHGIRKLSIRTSERKQDAEPIPGQ